MDSGPFQKRGQKLTGMEDGVISPTTDVPTTMQDAPGLEEEINHNAVYIRYSAQKSFDASLEAVHGLLSGEMVQLRIAKVNRETR